MLNAFAFPQTNEFFPAKRGFCANERTKCLNPKMPSKSMFGGSVSENLFLSKIRIGLSFPLPLSEIKLQNQDFRLEGQMSSFDPFVDESKALVRRLGQKVKAKSFLCR
ncbi:unnamed protein product [Arabidopsis halleri]